MPEEGSVHADGAEAVADWNNLKSGENYVGYGRTENFSSSGGARPDQRHEYSVPKALGINCWALSGIWTMGREAIALNQANGRIVYRFHARDLHLVMGPSAPGTSARFRVLIDGLRRKTLTVSMWTTAATALLLNHECIN